MQIKKPGIAVSTPVPLVNRTVKLDLKPIFLGITKGVAHFFSGSSSEIAGDIAEALGGLGLDSNKSEAAFLLIQRALINAGLDLARESLSYLPQTITSAAPSLSATMLSKIENSTLTLDTTFLRNPKSLSLLSDVAPLYEQWLVDMGCAPKAASLISTRFNSYFVYALSAEWRKNHSQYVDLIDAINTPFGAAEERQRDWESYFAVLERRVNENIFDEPFGLSQIYIPLNAYFIDKHEKCDNKNKSFDEESSRFVVGLAEELTEWVNQKQYSDAVRVISGGPGSGKSSFTKMFCAKLSRTGTFNPIYVPLHLIDPTRDIIDEIGRFVRDEGFLRFNPLDVDPKIANLVLIFDGLDELASQGKIAAQVAKEFIQAVERMVEKRNLGPSPILVIISGRELVVQENATEFRKTREILNVLPYFVPKNERNYYHDPELFLEIDLRDNWWTTYGLLTGKAFSGVPGNLKKHEIDEITAQPLLNYLVALSFTRGKLDFEKSLNLNSVYSDLIAAVYERGYDNNRIHKPISHITQKEFIRVMEEIGLAAWHGSDGRSTSVSEILHHCKESGLEGLMKTFQEGAEAGVTKLLAAFFFRQNGKQVSGDATFVFTHKSFGEFLTAIRIVRGVEQIVLQLKRRDENPDDGYDVASGLVQWIKLVGPAGMTSYIHRFLEREIRQRPYDELTEWHGRLSTLLMYVIKKNFPMERIGSLDFPEALRQSINASESLVVALNACAQSTELPIRIKFASPVSFGNFLRNVTPQRVGPQNTIFYSALSYFDFSGQALDMVDLYAADLRHTVWDDTRLNFANLARADLTGAIFTSSEMQEIDLSRANLTNAKFNGADTIAAKFAMANFTGASLTRVRLFHADVIDADFTNATLQSCHTNGVDFSEAKIQPTINDPKNGKGEYGRRPPSVSASNKRGPRPLRPTRPSITEKQVK